MASVMHWPTRRWPTFHVEPEESDNIVAARNAYHADAAQRSEPGVTRLEMTKSARRREVPMNAASMLPWSA